MPRGALWTWRGYSIMLQSHHQNARGVLSHFGNSCRLIPCNSKPKSGFVAFWRRNEDSEVTMCEKEMLLKGEDWAGDWWDPLNLFESPVNYQLPTSWWWRYSISERTCCTLLDDSWQTFPMILQLGGLLQILCMVSNMFYCRYCSLSLPDVFSSKDWLRLCQVSVAVILRSSYIQVDSTSARSNLGGSLRLSAWWWYRVYNGMLLLMEVSVFTVL